MGLFSIKAKINYLLRIELWHKPPRIYMWHKLSRMRGRRKDFFPGGAISGFLQAVVKSISPGGTNSDEIPFFQLETKRLLKS